jgi:two-component system, cell cycle response regulator
MLCGMGGRTTNGRDLAARAAWACALALMAAYVAVAAGAGGEGVRAVFSDWVYNGLLFAAAGLCVARSGAVPGERLAWCVTAAGLALLGAGDVWWTLFLSDLAEPAYPSVADGLWLASYPVTYAGLGLLVRARLRDSFRASLWLDGAIAALAVAAAATALVFDPVVEATGGSPAAVATNLAYPIGDFVLLALVAGMVALTGWRPGRAWALIGAGLAVRAIADCVYLVQTAGGTYVEGTLLDPLWPAASLLLAAGAWQRAPRAASQLDGWRLFAFPAGFTGLALSVYLVGGGTRLAVALATVALLVAFARMALVFRENLAMLAAVRTEAYTDALTGLGNRRRLTRDLDAALAAGDGLARVLVLFDLDGFKRYNDTYGHPAGDALLARLGAKLAAAVEPRGAAYRMGGDEFCALVATAPGGVEAAVTATARALRETGDGFEVRASRGAVELGREAATAREALQLADRRMYASKAAGDRPPSRQTADALLAILTERDPDLRRHLQAVAALAGATARRLGLTAEAVAEVVRAAELHDVGKMSIPDAILAKPGPLDAHEWAFVRRHPIVAERVLGAAPALAAAARIVRASAERWDGYGYPDGLRGEEIPLGARIVAVCEAYDAIRSARPHRPARSEAAALAELRRCAGSQLDPAVVEALSAELSPARAPRAAFAALAADPAPAL